MRKKETKIPTITKVVFGLATVLVIIAVALAIYYFAITGEEAGSEVPIYEETDITHGVLKSEPQWLSPGEALTFEGSTYMSVPELFSYDDIMWYLVYVPCPLDPITVEVEVSDGVETVANFTLMKGDETHFERIDPGEYTVKYFIRATATSNTRVVVETSPTGAGGVVTEFNIAPP